MYRLPSFAAAIALLFAAGVPAANAQDYFIPGTPRPAQQAPQPRPGSRPAPAPAAPPQAQPAAGATVSGDVPQQAQAQPVPELPPLPRSTTPPPAVIGVIGVPEVMRASIAAQMVDKVIGERRDRLNQDAQKEQAAWRDLQQQLANQRGTMSPEQIRTRERELQERITASQAQFRERNRVIQEAAQVSVGQIERMLVAVIRQVADSHGMNLVLHRAQVALNFNEFDITDQVADQLNKVVPSVNIPPETDLHPLAGGLPAPAPMPAGAASGPAAGPGPRR
jgi:Skp family chaperone for outer membrane proteins